MCPKDDKKLVIMKETPKYKAIISALNSSYEGYDEYIRMNKRICLFIESNGESEFGCMINDYYMERFALLQEDLYYQALKILAKGSC